jgi:hypothetical protein
MNKLLSCTALLLLLLSSCRKIQEDVIVYGGGGGNDSTSENTVLEGKISTDRTLKANYVYKIRGFVYVVNGAKLIIEPGTVIKVKKEPQQEAPWL